MYKGTSVRIRCIFCSKFNHELKTCHIYNELERQFVAKYPQADITSISQLCWSARPMICNIGRGWKFRRRNDRGNIVRRAIYNHRNTDLCNNDKSTTTTTKEKRKESMSTSKKKRLKRIKKWRRRLEELLQVKSSGAIVVPGGNLPNPPTVQLSTTKSPMREKLGEQPLKAKPAASSVKKTQEPGGEVIKTLPAAPTIKKTQMPGGEAHKTSSAASLSIKKTVVPGGKAATALPAVSTVTTMPGGKASQASAAATSEKKSLPSMNPLPSEQSRRDHAPVTGAPANGQGPSKQKYPEEKDFPETFSIQQWYAICIDVCQNFKDKYQVTMSKEELIELSLDVEKGANDMPVYDRIVCDGKEVYINQELYFSQMSRYFLEDHVKLDEDLHLWVLPDPTEACFFTFRDKENYERVKVEFVKHYIRNAPKFI